jgi:hypothetical protein
VGEPELASLAWRKSSLSGNGPDCVEVAFSAEAAYVRNSRRSDGHVLSFLPHEWKAFIAGVQNGEFEFPAAEGERDIR